MKKIIKTVLTAALIAGSTSVFAQKLGCINMQELIFAMPETAEMQKNLEAYQKELQDQLETISVEFNNKLADYTKLVNDKNTPMSDSVKQLKEKELNDLKTRYDEFAQMSQQDMQKRQGELLEPIIVKAQNAVTEVAKADGYTVVYDTSINSLAYYDTAAVTDILPAVKTKLGIKDTPAATAPTVTTPEAMAPDMTAPTENITTPGVTDTPGTTVVPGVTDTPGTTDTPGAAVIPETLTIHLNGNGGEPAFSTMTESMDAVSAEEWSVPFRLGKVFDGWYLDAGCTVPFTGVNPEDYAGADAAALEVYAGWRELDGFACNDAGHIISCAGGSVIDGIFALPSDAACTGIEAGALSSVAGLITEVYIPANITYIGPGAFDGLGSLMYIEAAPGNPNYYSVGGVLYTMSGEVVAAPVWF